MATAGHTLVAYSGVARGLENFEVDEAVMKSDLEAHWEVVTEGAQTILRNAGMDEAYNRVKVLIRGRELTQAVFNKWIDDLSVEDFVKDKLRLLSPLTYLGLAEQIADRSLKEK